MTPRTVWITGAGSGIGRAVALSAARAGRRVALSGRRVDELQQTAADAESAGGEALVVAADVGDQAAVDHAHQAVVDTWGRVDDLVLAAGLNAPARTWADQDLASVAAIVDINLTGTARVITATLPDLRRAGGQVVVVSSYSAWRFSPGAGVAYAASKSGLAMLCQTLNAQEAGSGVRACHLCPGDVATDFLRLRPNVPDAEARSVMLTPDDVAAAVQFVLDAPPHVRVDELVVSPVSQI